jgi:uncharacterized protein (DUF1800 family)
MLRSLTAVVCVLSLMPAAPPAKNSDGVASFATKLPKDKEALHALNRLTFGPRPGDVEVVQRMGVKKWIELQLHPERIRESEVLTAKLATLETLRLNNQELTLKYPPPQVIIGVATGRIPLPDNPELRARYERLAGLYKERIQAREKKQGKSEDEAEPMEPAKARKPITEILTREQIRTLRNGTPEERAEVLKQLPPGRLSEFIGSAPGMGRRLMGDATPEIRRNFLMNLAPGQAVVQDLYEGKMYRAVYSERQLEEVLADFWFNHFNVYLDKGADRFLTTGYERDAIRPHVLGRFGDMLRATAEHPAMLFYLDNWQSVGEGSRAAQRGVAMKSGGNNRKRGLNENYARELLELHTLGVDGGYTQKDIIEVARCFSGWTIREPRRGGEFRFEPRMHDPGEKTVLGVKIPAGGGMDDGFKVLEILERHPSTARFVSRKLAQRFVADNPPDSLVAAMAATFTKTKGDLRAVMRTMLESREFWSAGAYRAKVKSPLELVASAVRATGAEVRWAFPLAQKVGELGQPLYRKQEPTGYPNTSQDWVNSAALLARMNFALALAQNQLSGVRVSGELFEGDSTSVAKKLLAAEPSAQTKQAIERGLAEKKEAAVIAGLILGSPEFQRR